MPSTAKEISISKEITEGDLRSPEREKATTDPPKRLVSNSRVVKRLLNLAIRTKSATPGKIKLTFDHTAVGNKSLGGSVVDFPLTGDLSSPSVISLKI